MASGKCLCGNPQHCVCNGEQPLRPFLSQPLYPSSPSYQYNPYSYHCPTPYSTPGPVHQSYYSTFSLAPVSTFNSPSPLSTSIISNTTRSSTKRKTGPQEVSELTKRANTSPDTPEATSSPPTATRATMPPAPTFSHSESASTEPAGSLIVSKSTRRSPNAIATDVWHFIRPLTTTEKPAHLPAKEEPHEVRPDDDVYSFLGCKLCPFETTWTVWKNTSGQSKCIRNHLKNTHEKIWRELVVLNKLKGWEKGYMSERGDGGLREHLPFSIDGFHERLVKWIAVDDQSMRVVDSSELRDLLLYVGEQLEDEDIPHRSKIAQLVTDAFQREKKAMINEIKDSLGNVSLTTDIWSRVNLESYMGVTAHYILRMGRQLSLRHQLVAFRAIQGSHTGENIGKELYSIVEDIGCLSKLGMVTTDNASNNNTMMSELERELKEQGILFDSKGNRIRCFPHVINLAVKAALVALVSPPDVGPLSPTATPEEIARHEKARAYHQSLETDVVGKVRKFVNAVRASGQRRDIFEQVIKDLNKSGELEELLREVGLLKDMDVRWSSTFMMIDRFVELFQACMKFIQQDWDFEAVHQFTEVDLLVLRDVQELLFIFHCVQELVSAEKTPTLSVVVPLYEKLIVMLKEHSESRPQLQHAITPAITKLRNYLAETRSNKSYVMAMVLNPTIKFDWIRRNWSADEYATARRAVVNMLLENYKTQQGVSAPTSMPSSSFGRRLIKTSSASSGAALAQASGMSRINALARSISESAVSTRSAGIQGSAAVNPGRDAVEDEIRRYELEGVMTEEESGDLDLIRYWQERQFRFRLLFRSSLDVLPIQASAVPSERVFSSSKETDTMRRSSLGKMKMEELQMLKYRYRNDRLTFTDSLVCSEQEVSELDLDPSYVNELLATGQLELLEKYIDESHRGWGLDA